MPETQSIHEKLEAAGQAHLLRFEDALTDQQRRSLYEQIEEIDFDHLPALIERYVKSERHAELPKDLEPADYFPRDPASEVKPWDPAKARAAGDELLGAGRVACFTVAGGQGSRLGFDGPKGCFPAGAVTGKTLFQIFAEGILATEHTYGSEVPWYIMTSPQNHEATVAFFKDHDYFGLDPARVMFFPQGTMPSMDKETGRILLADKGTIATNPDGHGGSLRALVRSGATADMVRRGVEHISYFQVDNPNVRVADPVFLGLHAAAGDSSAEMSSKMLPKAAPEEKVGVFCRSGGRTTVIEYSDLPDELTYARNEHGNLRFNAGSIAIHALSVAFVEKIAGDPAFSLPWHRAVKKVPHVDLETGERVEPGEPNAVKLERFVFDAIPMAEASIVFETDRVEEFAPIKNKEGVDSIETSKRLQTERAARWLHSAGVEIPRDSEGHADCTLEISPLTALSAEQLRQRDDLPTSIDRGSTHAL